MTQAQETWGPGAAGIVRGALSGAHRALIDRSIAAFIAGLTGKTVPATLTLGLDRHGIDSSWKYRLLYLAMRAMRPAKVVETGVLHGLSSRAMLAAMHDNAGGELLSIDLPTVGHGRTNADGRWDGAHIDGADDVGREIPAYLRARWRLVLARSTDPEAIEAVRAWAPIDVFLHDSEHAYGTMRDEYALAWSVLRPGGLLLSDDIDWTSAFDDFARSVRRPGFAVVTAGRRAFGGVRK